MLSFNWADWVLIALIALSSLISLKRGFVKEALSLVTWVVAFIVARTFHSNMQTLLAPSIDEPIFRMMAAFLILFVATLILGSILSYLVSTLVKLTGLSPLDRMLGVVFGLTRGLIISVVLVAILRLTPFEQAVWWQNSVMIENLAILEQWSRSVLDSRSNG